MEKEIEKETEAEEEAEGRREEGVAADDISLGTLLEKFYVSLSSLNAGEIIEAYVNLETYCPDPSRGETWDVQDEIVNDARRKCVTLLRAPFVEKTNQLNIASRKRLKQRTALSDNDGTTIAHGQRYMFIMMDVLGTWSNWLMELRGFGFRREMITQLMTSLYPRIIEIVWDTFQTFKQDKDLEKLCAKSTDINAELHLNTLDNTLQQLATMRSLVNKHYIFQYDLFTPYFLIEYNSEDALLAVPLLERLVLSTNEELQHWKELDFLYSSLEAAYLLRSVTVACQENGLLEVEDGVYILHLVEDVLFLMNKVMDRALLTQEDSVVFALGNKILELVYFGNHGGMQDALLYEIVSTSFLYRRVAQRGCLTGARVQAVLQEIVTKCTGKSFAATEEVDHHPPLPKNNASNPSMTKMDSASNFQTPSKPPLRPGSHTVNSTAKDHHNPGVSKPALSLSNVHDSLSSSEALDTLWKGANSWLTNLASPYIPRTGDDQGGEDYATDHGHKSPAVPQSPTPAAAKTMHSPTQPSLEELLLKAFDEDGEHGVEGHGTHGDRDEDDYDSNANADDPANAVNASLTTVLMGGAQTAAAASAVGVSGGFLLLSATSSLVSAFLSDGADNLATSTNAASGNSGGNENEKNSAVADFGTQIQPMQQLLVIGFEKYIKQLYKEVHVQYAHSFDSAEKVAPSSSSPLFGASSAGNASGSGINSQPLSEGFISSLMPKLPIALLDADNVVQLNTMMILTQGIRNLQDALHFAAHSDDLFLNQRSHRMFSPTAAGNASSVSSFSGNVSSKSNISVLLREYSVCIQLYRDYIVAEVQSLAMRQLLRHLPTFFTASQGLMTQSSAGGGGGSVYGMLGNWLLGANATDSRGDALKKRNESLLQATSLFFQSHFEVSGAEMEQRWSLQLLRGFVSHFLTDLAPLGPSFIFKLQEAQEIVKNGEAAKYSFGGLAMSLFANSSSNKTSTGPAAANGATLATGDALTTNPHRKSDFCYVLARQYVLCFLQILFRILTEQCLLQRQFNEWGALLFQEEIRTLARFVSAIFEDNSIASLSMRTGAEDGGNDGDDPRTATTVEEEEEGMLSWRMVKRQLQSLVLAVKLLSLDAPADIVRYNFVSPLSRGRDSESTSSLSNAQDKQQKPSGYKIPAGAVEMAEDDIRAILARRSDFSKDVVQKVKINFINMPKLE
jgi:hypothetical protein